MFEHFNVVYWVIAFASLVAWARFAAFVSRDITANLVDQPEIPWKVGYGSVLLIMFLVYLLLPNFWIALVINVVIAGSAVGGFWFIRVKTLGAAGHLFKGAIQSVSAASNRMEERKNARQVQLTYLKHDDSPLALPKADDPLAAGLGAADQMIIQALVRRAEQIDLVPHESAYTLILTTDGVPFNQPPLDRATAETAVQAFKTLAGLSVEERRRPQVGKFKTRDAEGTSTVWTVRSSGSTAGERLILNGNEKGQWDLPLEQLGFTADQLTDVKNVGQDTKGVVIVASPRANGRSTTLYALMRQHDAFTNSVQTLETNPQSDIEGVTVNKFDSRNTELTYAKALQSIILKDPNVLLSAQLPDAQTATALTRFAMEGDGRRVYVGMPATDTIAALEVWMSVNQDKTAAANALRMIIAERLVRILCPTCKIPYQPDEATLKRLNMPVGRSMQSFKANTEPIIDKRGHKIICPDCSGIGFKGRSGTFEVLVMNDELRKLAVSGANANQLRAAARKNNMVLLVEHGIRKFATGVTAINEVTRAMSAGVDKNPAAGKSGSHPAQK